MERDLSVLTSILLSSLVVYQTKDPMLGFGFGALLGFLLVNRLIRNFKR